MSNALQLDALQQSIDLLSERIKQLSKQNQTLQNKLEGSENVRRLLVRKNQHLSDQVRQIIKDLKESHIS